MESGGLITLLYKMVSGRGDGGCAGKPAVGAWVMIRGVGASEEPRVKGVRYHGVFTYQLVLVAAPDHPLAGRDSVTVEEAAA